MRISEDRPKISVKDDFELVLFRWRYLNKTVNPTEEEISKYNSVIKAASGKIYSIFTKVFSRSGMQLDDVRSLARVHIVSYIGLFSLNKNKIKRLEFENSFIKNNNNPPSQKEIDKKDIKTAYAFVYQRLLENALHCKRKISSEFKKETVKLYFLSTDRDSINNSKKIKNRTFLKKYNFIQFVEIDEFFAKKIVEQNGLKMPNSGLLELPDGSAIRILKKTIFKDPTYLDISEKEIEDSPEEIYLKKEEAFLDSILKQKFDSMKSSTRTNLLKKFLKNSKNKGLEKERKEAYKILRATKDEELKLDTEDVSNFEAE